jgi:hypothetical protein
MMATHNQKPHRMMVTYNEKHHRMMATPVPGEIE